MPPAHLTFGANEVLQTQYPILRRIFNLHVIVLNAVNT